MKKAIALLSVLALVIAAMTGCGKKNRDDIITRTEPTKSVTGAVTAAPTDEPVKPLTAEEAYAQFVKGNLEIEMTTGYADLDPSVMYTIGDLGNFISSEYLSYRLLPQKLDSIAYGLLDCGNDGTPELAVKYTYIDENYGLSPLEEVLVFGWENGKMKFITGLRSDGTKSASVKQTGFVSRTDTSDPDNIEIDYSYIGSDLTEKKLYSVTFAQGLTEAVIPAQFLPEELMSLAGDRGEESGDILLSLYNFSGEERGSEAFLKQSCYVFTTGGETPEEIAPEESLEKEYAEGGLKRISRDAGKTMEIECAAAAGVTDSDREAQSISWTGAAPEAYAEIRSGTDTQLVLMINSRDMWFKNETSGDIFYAVADLNMDGRLELIRTEMKYDPKSTVNRFWQVSADYRTLQPMDYESQFKLADGSEDTAQPSLMNLDTVYSYWNFSYTDYYYVFPTSTYTEDGDILRMMMLDFTDGGQVKYVCDLGTSSYSYAAGDTKYFDHEGNECSEDEFNDQASKYFDFEERTWVRESVRLAFVTIKDGNDLNNMMDMLFNSYTLIEKETIE